MHTELRVKLFEGVVDNLGEKQANLHPNDSLSLNFGKEPAVKANGQNKMTEDPHWKDVRKMYSKKIFNFLIVTK